MIGFGKSVHSAQWTCLPEIQGADGGHVLVLQCVLALALSGESRLRLGIAQANLALLSTCTAFQVVAGKVLARVAAVGRVLGLSRRVYGGSGLLEHRVLASRW